MLNPGVYTLAQLNISGPIAEEGTPYEHLDGMTAVSLEARFEHGGAEGRCAAIVRTSFDGQNWIDIARFDFDGTSAVKHCNLEGLLSKRVTTYSALRAEGVNDGVLGNRLRAFIEAAGGYVDTTISVRASVR
jgi:hypothetical protein